MVCVALTLGSGEIGDLGGSLDTEELSAGPGVNVVRFDSVGGGALSGFLGVSASSESNCGTVVGGALASGVQSGEIAED